LGFQQGPEPRAQRPEPPELPGSDNLPANNDVHVIAIAIVAATAASYAVGWLLDVPVLVPFLNTAASFPFMVLALKRADLRLAVSRMLLWALVLGACATGLSYVRPAATDRFFLRGEAYRREMFAWVMTGRGAESTPAQFIPQQAGHAALFAGLTVATGGALSMPMGATLMNYMGHYVGALSAGSAQPPLTDALGWHPWAVIRIASFVILGVVLSMPLLSRLAGFQPDWPAARRLVIVAAAGLVLDVALKWMLAPVWQRLLLRSLSP
jgi:hypothetical protein